MKGCYLLIATDRDGCPHEKKKPELIDQAEAAKQLESPPLALTRITSGEAGICPSPRNREMRKFQKEIPNFRQVVIGDDANIGANAVVLCDVPPGKTAVGIPAKLIPTRHRDCSSRL